MRIKMKIVNLRVKKAEAAIQMMKVGLDAWITRNMLYERAERAEVELHPATVEELGRVKHDALAERCKQLHIFTDGGGGNAKEWSGESRTWPYCR